MIDGMKKGLTFRCPRSRSVACVSSSVVRPPMPEPMTTPHRSPSGLSSGSPESCRAICAPASPYWMKRSLRRASFLSMYCSGLNPFTSPAMRLGSSFASKWVMRPIPLLPETHACQAASVPIPMGVTKPRPVTTTLLSTRCMRKLSASFAPRFRAELLLVLVDEADRILDGLDVLRLLVGDLDLELLFHRHDQLDDVERVRAEVLDEGAFGLDLVLADPALLRDDALDLRLDGHALSLLQQLETRAWPNFARPCSTRRKRHKRGCVRNPTACHGQRPLRQRKPSPH